MIIEKDANAAKQRAANRKSHNKNGRTGRVYPVRFRDEKVRARECIRRLISGEHHKGPPCEGCGAKAGPGIQAHHHDYSKPYDVEWFCSRCHAAEDRGELIKTGPKAPPIVRPFQTCVRCGNDCLLQRARCKVFLCPNCRINLIGCAGCMQVKPRQRGNRSSTCNECQALYTRNSRMRKAV